MTLSIQLKYGRVVLLIDMDCFYCQVEEKDIPDCQGKPMAVIQHNEWNQTGGGIIAVNYAARDRGVTRHMYSDEAKKQCPDILLVKVPNLRGKADLTKYRIAGEEVAKILKRFTSSLERASVDEAYLDITDTVMDRINSLDCGIVGINPEELKNTYVAGTNHLGAFLNYIVKNYDENYEGNKIEHIISCDLHLLVGATLATEIRAVVKNETGYECSAGIAHNKILAKLACGLNKPNKQTILPRQQISILFATLPVRNIRGLGGKFGEELTEILGIKFMGQLERYTEKDLQRKFGEKNGSWLFNISQGIDLEPVTEKLIAKSIGCCKQFPGRNCITGIETLKHWINELSTEMSERLQYDLETNNRKAKQMVVSFKQEIDGRDILASRTTPLSSYDSDVIANVSLQVIKNKTAKFFRNESMKALNNPVKYFGISVGKFETISNTKNHIQEMFAKQIIKSNENSTKESTEAIESIKNNTELKNEKNEKKEKNGKNMKNFFAMSSTEDHERITDNVIDLPISEDRFDTTAIQIDETEMIDRFNARIFENEHKNSEELFVSEESNAENRITKNVIKLENFEDANSNSMKTAEMVIATRHSTTEDDFIETRPMQASQHNRTLNILLEDSDSSVSETNDVTENLIVNEESLIRDVLNISRSEYRSTNNTFVEDDEEPTTSKRFFQPISYSQKHQDFRSSINNADKINGEEIIDNIYDKTNEITEKINTKIHNEREYIFSHENNQGNDNKNLKELINTIEKNNNRYVEEKSFSTEINNKRKFIEVSENLNNSDNLDIFRKFTKFDEFIEYTKCNICSASIANDGESVQIHMDYHLARDLKKKQSEEYLTQIRTKIKEHNISNPTNKKKYTKKTELVQSLKVDIRKYFGNAESNEQGLRNSSTTTLSSDEIEKKELLKELCLVCNKHIIETKFQQHFEAHFD